jgi:hypothetical protein
MNAIAANRLFKKECRCISDENNRKPSKLSRTSLEGD